MANGYMPRKDQDARAWLINFAQQLGERPSVYKVSTAEADAVREGVDAFDAALQKASGPDTRTSLAVLRKDEARLAAELACRGIYLRVKFDPTIPDADKFVLGVRLVNASRSRIAPPDSPPELQAIANLTHAHVLRYANPGHLGQAKPTCAVGIQIFRQLVVPGFGSSPVRQKEEPSPLEYAGTFTRNPISIPYTAKDDLKLAIYVARWITRRGLVGPWSRPVSVRVASAVPNVGMRAAA